MEKLCISNSFFVVRFIHIEKSKNSNRGRSDFSDTYKKESNDSAG